jgi:outer membrane protein OmpA-like peptidoglycan-associated protein
VKRLFLACFFIVSFTANAFQMKREAYIDIPTANIARGLYINVNASYPVKDVDDVKFDPNIGIDLTYDNFGGALKWYDDTGFALDLSYKIFTGSDNIPGLTVGISEITLNKYISTAGADEVFNDENYADRPPEAWSFYAVARKNLNRLIEVNAGLGRGKFIGYGSLSKYANTDVFTDDKHEIWAFGLFGGMRIIFTNNLAFLAEGDGRDINIGIEYQNGLVKGTLALSKLEVFNDEESDLSPRVGLNFSYRIMNLKEEGQKEKKKFPVVIELIDEKSREPVEGYAIITGTKGDTLETSGSNNTHSFALVPGIYTAFISAIGYKDKKTAVAVKGKESKNLYTIEMSKMEESIKPVEIEDSAKTINNFEYVKGEIEGMVVKFPYGEAELTGKARDILNKITELIKDNKNVRLLITGHTCSIGTLESNQMLSEKRAGNVKKYLVQGSIFAERISTEALGERRPAADNSTEEGRIKNRRAEFVLYRTKE